MSFLSAWKPIPTKLDSFVFELLRGCNHTCAHCYNSWKAPGQDDAPDALLSTDETVAMALKLAKECGASLVSLTGGEPMLRDDFFEIVDGLFDAGLQLNLISNASRLDARAVDELAGKISIFELPLLGATREAHDRISGRQGAFDDVTQAIAHCKSAGQMVVAVFVATRENLADWAEVYQLAFAMGCDGVMFNRFNPGGTGAGHVERLQASPAELSAALDDAQRLVDELEMPVSCSIPMPACLFDHSRWPALSFGYCAAGTARAYYTLDAVGNVRPCNHSATVLGNIRQQHFRRLARSKTMKTFAAARPALCAGCSLETTCQGGCKAAAEICSGDCTQPDPFLNAWAHQRHPV